MVAKLNGDPDNVSTNFPFILPWPKAGERNNRKRTEAKTFIKAGSEANITMVFVETLKDF